MKRFTGGMAALTAAFSAQLALGVPCAFAATVLDRFLAEPDIAPPLALQPLPCAGRPAEGGCSFSLPERPAAPDLFGLSATPAYAQRLLSAWDKAWSPPLQEFEETSFQELVLQAEAMPPEERAAFINRWVNWHIRYIEEVNDQWATANETLARRTGDCEDFAILKLAILERVGFDRDKLFLVIVRDRHSPLIHAVAGIRGDDDYAMSILDNLTDVIRSADQVSEYEPTVSFSGPFSWIYGQRRQSAMATSGKSLPPDHAKSVSPGSPP